MKDYKIIGKVTHYACLNNSYYGNPRYEVIIESEADIIRGKTQAKNSVGYSILNNLQGVNEFTYHYTRTSNIIITKMKEISR